MEGNLLYYGDNLDVPRRHIKDESVDLVYLDPPFNSNQGFNVLFAEQDGSRSAAQVQAFSDTWRWDQGSAKTFDSVIDGGGRVAETLQALRSILGTNDMLAYLSMMAPLLVELRRVLRPTGSIYLHCDPTDSHYLKVLLDAVFNPDQFRNEIIWQRTSAHNDPRRFGNVTDSIFFYSKTDNYYWEPQYTEYSAEHLSSHYGPSDERGHFMADNLTGPGTTDGESGSPWRSFDPTKTGRHWAVPRKIRRELNLPVKGHVMECLEALDKAGFIHWTDNGTPRVKRYLSEMPGTPLQNIWTDIPPVNSQADERLDYPTQKPEALLDRIIVASSKEGDTVLDPFCGCGTTIASTQRLGRRWIGIDITHLAITLIRSRLSDAYGNEVHYQVVGEPQDLTGARALASEDRYQFQWWALGKVGARPAESDQKKGSDRGIDGRLYFRESDKSSAPLRNIVLQVKSGHVSSRDVRDLVGVVDREKAAIGVLITLEEPTRDMVTEAVSANFYKPSYATDEAEKYPRIQIIPIKDLLEGKGIQKPYFRNVTFKKAPEAKQVTMKMKVRRSPRLSDSAYHQPDSPPEKKDEAHDI